MLHGIADRILQGPVPLIEFFRDQSRVDESAFLERWTGAFLLGRSRSRPPS